MDTIAPTQHTKHKPVKNQNVERHVLLCSVSAHDGMNHREYEHDHVRCQLRQDASNRTPNRRAHRRSGCERGERDSSDGRRWKRVGEDAQLVRWSVKSAQRRARQAFEHACNALLLG